MFDDEHFDSIAYLCDTLGIAYNGVMSAKAQARRTVLDAMEDAENAPVDDTDDEPKPPPDAPKSVAPPTATLPRPELLPRPLEFFATFSWAQAVHEAGHLVGALARGVRVHGASVGRECVARRDCAPDSHTEAVVIFAGPAAEGMLTDSPDFDTAITGDMANLAALGLGERAEATARTEAMRLVTVHRNAIGRIAASLAQWGTISGAEATELFNLNK